MRHTDIPADAEFPPSAATPAEDEAAHWVARLTSGNAGEQELSAFLRWRAASPAHEAALARMRGIWLGLNRVLDDRALGERAAVERTAGARAAPPPRRRRARRPWAVAASLLAALAIGWMAATPWRYDEVTGTGERRQILLADGSDMLLGSGSAVDLHFDAQRREVRLARGEAYFDVVPDAGRAFLVRAGAIEARVLGTHFAVRIDRSGPMVTVNQGRVEVRTGNDTVVLIDGQRTRLRDSALAPVENVDAARETAWRHGRLVFEGTTLAEIARELNRHRSGTVLVAGAAARGERFNAVIDLDRIDVWLAGLEQSASLDVVRLGPVVVIH